ncbi:MAG TPA: NADH-quinone oxidoreductase subunit NuoE [Desulfobaccales bacterium]|nr:NADH-quinone oxidoreductase subunit NuoE [Desulfobaccales bacterium]
MTSHEKLENIMSHYEGVAADLIPVLQDIQDEFNYLPKNEMKIVAARLQVPLTRVYSVATFFKMFSLEPRGKHLIRVCLGTACHLRGGQRLVETVGRRLNVEPFHTTEDRQFSLETVGCLGSCAQAPLMMIDNKYFGQMAVDKVPKILKPYKS